MIRTNAKKSTCRGMVLINKIIICVAPISFTNKGYS